MPTRTRFVFLMHPKEFKQEKAATGRLTRLCLDNSEIIMGVSFDKDARVAELLADPKNVPVLLYPGTQAINVSDSSSAPERLKALGAGDADRQLVVFLLDATWSLGHKMLRVSTCLQRLPRIMFTPTAPSRFVIKQQPVAGCLSTLEAVHELLLALEHARFDTYPLPAQLLELFGRMQDFQIRCASDPNRTGYRHRSYKLPADRKPHVGRSGTRRARVFKAPPTNAE